MSPQRDELLKWRKEFPILEKATYLISNSLGAMPRGVYVKLEEFADTWAARGVRAWSDSWWDLPITAGDTIAPLIGARPGEVSMHANISLLQAMLISCFDFRKRRNKIVLTDLEFPSVLYVYERFAKQQGARIKIIRSEDGISIPTEKLLSAIDEKTMLVPISHVLFRSAFIQDIHAIVEKARACGATLILDAYHSVGIIPVDVRKLGVDVLVGGVLKWLCGGPGAAFLWIRPSLRMKLKPGITGWFAHRNPFAFETAMKYSNDVARFLNGTPSIPALAAAQVGPGIIAQIGIKKIRQKSMRQTALLIAEAERRGFGIRSPREPGRRAGTVTVDVPHGYEVSRELIRRNIIVDYRKGSGIRLAPHFYNSDQELLFAIEQIEAILRRKAYRKHTGKRSAVT
ncbi:MAG TPA: aminotransferase class V-fold PLP-dependent enzyme [Bacteroidota bacterium]|nr:aminotransferase class V-fold PLP-dependent enzyme [Bacteroidota bacterium]